MQVHRFGDRIAVYVGGKTAYLEVKEARALATALQECAADTATNPFSQSIFKTFNLEIEED